MHIRDMLRLWKQLWRERDYALSPDEERKIAEFAETLQEPDRTIFLSWRRCRSTERIARQLNIDRDAVRDSLNQSYARMIVTVFPREPEANVE